MPPESTSLLPRSICLSARPYLRESLSPMILSPPPLLPPQVHVLAPVTRQPYPCEIADHAATYAPRLTAHFGAGVRPCTQHAQGNTPVQDPRENDAPRKGRMGTSHPRTSASGAERALVRCKNKHLNGHGRACAREAIGGGRVRARSAHSELQVLAVELPWEGCVRRKAIQPQELAVEECGGAGPTMSTRRIE